jgi:hypothetical protein
MWILFLELSRNGGGGGRGIKAFFRGLSELQFGKMGQPQKTSDTVSFEVYSTRNSLTHMQK